jgi:serine/threonine-protein kinase SRPK3
LHTANIAFTIPPVDALSEEEVLKIIHAPIIGMVTRADGGQLEPGIPNYLVWPTSFPISKSTTASPVKIIDFGESFISSNKPDTLHTPLVVRAPEVIFEDNWDYRVDLWSMGCMVSICLEL